MDTKFPTSFLDPEKQDDMAEVSIPKKDLISKRSNEVIQTEIEEKLLSYIKKQKFGLRTFSFDKDWGQIISSEDSTPEDGEWKTVKKRARRKKKY